MAAVLRTRSPAPGQRLIRDAGSRQPGGRERDATSSSMGQTGARRAARRRSLSLHLGTAVLALWLVGAVPPALGCDDLAPVSDHTGVLPDLVISELVPGSYIELFNTGRRGVPLSSAPHALCEDLACSLLADLAPGAEVPPGGYARLPWPDLFSDSSVAGEAVLYADDLLDSGVGILDYVCWGASPPEHWSAAVGAGKWEGSCVPLLQEGAISRFPGTTGASLSSYDFFSPPSPCPILFDDGFETEGASRWSGGAALPPDCIDDLLCAEQPPGKACIAGRLRDFETSGPVRDSPLDDALCTAVTASGPCSLSISVTDFVAFAQNPSGTVPLALDEHVVDRCGRFRLSGFQVPGFGLVVVTIDDDGAAPDEHVLSGVLLAVGDGDRLDLRRGYAVRHDTDLGWTAGAGDPFGAQSFSVRGVFAPVFLRGATPVQGVAITANGSVQAGDDYYFSDSDPLVRTTIDPSASSTGVDGAGLLVDSGLMNHSGMGGEPPGCEWPSVLASTVPGVVLVHDFKAVDGTTGEVCP